jgi:hypothetical protein
MVRKVTLEFAERTVERNGTMYKFTKDASPSYGYVQLKAWKWSGWQWELLHDIELY